MIESFVAAARRALPHEALDRYKVRVIGRSPEKIAQLLALIVSGAKTGTFSLAAEFEAKPGDLPRAGDVCVLTQADGTPAAIVRITAVERVRFASVTAAHLAVESPRLRDLSAWREVHRASWAPLLTHLRRELTDDTQVLCQTFVLVWPPQPSR
jgi:uncharacterized protein YhfF